VPTTTIDIVQAAFRTAIDAVEPRMEEQRGTARWRFYEGERHASTDARWYRFEWDDEGFTPDGFMGPMSVDTSYTMTLVVDYGGIRRARAKVLAGDDQYQLRDVLNRLKNVVPGLRWVEALDWDFVPGTDQNQAQVEMQFLVRIMKARA
jgi:hypothetical protein